MGINPKSLAAFAGPNQGERKQPGPIPDSEEVSLDDEASEGEELEDTEGSDEDEEEEAFEEYGEGRYGKLIPLLEEHAEGVEYAAEAVDGDLLTMPEEDLTPSDIEALKDGYDELDRALKKQLKACCSNIPMDHCTRLAEHLENEDMISDAPRVAGWLFRLGQWLKDAE
jgi:hypothetical protein